MCSVGSKSLLTVGRFFYKSSRVYTCKVLEYSQFTSRRLFSTDILKRSFTNENHEEKKSVGIISDHREFRDEDAEIILDVDEEKERLALETINAIQNIPDPYEGLNMKRGVNGVFDIEDLVALLKKDKARNIFVVSVPKELGYVDYLVVVSGKSTRHMSALATLVRKAFKLKMHKSDLIPKIEGHKSKDWMALDMGNIALHIFSDESRSLYDLESLWSVGSKYDRETNKPDLQKEFQDKYMQFLSDFEPAEEEKEEDEDEDEENKSNDVKTSSTS